MKKDDGKRWLTLNMIQGYIAMYAVRQSPYHCPKAILNVLTQFRVFACDKFDVSDMAHMSRSEVRQLLKDYLWPIPEFQNWNERANGNQSPFGFCSRDYKPNPDDDFIDLDALALNVVRDLFLELDRHYASDHDFDRRWFWSAPCRWFRSLRYKFFPDQPATPPIPK